jgi:nucleoside-diphosphate-sugar epimerase
MSRHRTVIVTGGSGFVGTNLVEAFQSNGWRVWNLDLAPPRNPAHAGLWNKIDICDKSSMLRLFLSKRPDTVIHCAARTDLRERENLDGYRTNIDGICSLIDVLRAVGFVRRGIFFSTQLVCALGYHPSNPEDYAPSTMYGRSKVVMEKIIRSARDFLPVWTIVRPTSLWGPWFEEPYRDFFSVIRSGLYVHPEGIRTRKQWGYIGNAVFQIQSLIRAPARSIHEKTFFLADYTPIELSEFADKVAAAFGSPMVRKVPLWMLAAVGLVGEKLETFGLPHPPLTRFRLENILAEELHDLSPLRKITGRLPFSVEEGLQETVRWLVLQDGAK